MLSTSKSGQYGGYTISRSVRLRSSASAYLNRTPASASNRKTWTWSAWVKRGALGAGQILIKAGTTGVNGWGSLVMFNFTSADVLRVQSNNDIYLATTQVFRDPSAWYHVVLLCDTTQATASNRLRMFVNGVEITAFSTDGRSTYISQNSDSAFDNTVSHEIGRNGTDGNYFDGYLTEINFIDGQALTPSSFGQYNAYGVWTPAKYNGTYGTNGFYLNFSDNSGATSTTIGKDYSGNGNNWTPNNISVTAGATYDSMTDVPTLNSPTAANYCVLNPLSNDSTNTLSAANLNYSIAANQNGYPTSTFQFSSGKWYWECTVTSTHNIVGIVLGTTGTTTQLFTTGYGYYYTGNKYVNGVSSAYGASYTTNDVIGVAVDLDSGTPTITFYKNGSSQGSITIAAGTYKIAGGNGNSAATATGVYNFGQRPFAQTQPTGYNALNTFNLPATTINNGATVMAATTYTGTGTSLSVSNGNNNTTGVTFKPDLVWIKSRSAATDHKLTDSVRGTTKALISDTTGAETTDSNGLTAFGTGGFTVGTDTVYNNNTATYVGWQWQAGQGTTSSNTSGSITSTVSVNTTAGFSVVTASLSGTSPVTVGHGLGVQPKLIIGKVRNNASTNWYVQHANLTNFLTYYLMLNSSNAQASSSNIWDGAPTSTVFTVGNPQNGWNGGTAGSYNYVFYCWAAVAGYSAFGSYTGNASTDGPFVYCGFKPRFVLVKCYDNTGLSWFILDSSRNTYNVADARLFPDQSAAETTGQTNADMLSNGFKVRTTGTSTNGSGYNYIYAAFAENPFKYSLAR